MAFMQIVRSSQRGFTLVELLVVMAIMGLLGTISVGGYRAMQRGMEERGTMDNVNRFIDAAYRRAQIDRVPVVIYFWNELLQKESDYATRVIVGRAVAVRASGRITKKEGKHLYDEFGDLRYMRLTKDEDEEGEQQGGASSNSKGNEMSLYNMDPSKSGSGGSGDDSARSSVSQFADPVESPEKLLTTGDQRQIESYAFIVTDGSQGKWSVGDPYGFEFAEIQLPHNYIFGGSDGGLSESSPSKSAGKISFGPTGSTGGGTIEVSSLRPDASGEVRALTVGTSKKPKD